MNIDVDKVVGYKKVQYRFGSNLVSLDLPVGSAESDTTLGELIPEDDVKSEFDIVSDNELSKKLNELLLELTDREREVIIMRFGALMLDLRTDFSLPCKLIAEEHFLYDSIFTRI